MNNQGETRCRQSLFRKLAAMVTPGPNLRIARKKDLKLLTLAETQKINLNLLQVFTDFCEKHGLRYLLWYGTLLGALRHKGYIPWDDDVDVTMPLPDYYKFRELFEKENTNPQYELLYGMKKNVGIGYTMLGDMRTIAYMEWRDQAHSRPIAVDILPCYAVSDDDEVARRHLEEMTNLTKQSMRLLTGKGLSWKRRLFYAVMGRDRLLAKVLKTLENRYHQHPWGSTKRVRVMTFNSNAILGQNPKLFDEYLQQSFEGGSYRIPRNYDELLSTFYGNYMELPPEEQRIPNYSQSYISNSPIRQ